MVSGERSSFISTLPRSIALIGKKIAFGNSNKLTEVQKIQKILLTDERLSSVWKYFSKLPNGSQEYGANLFFSKLPELIQFGRKVCESEFGERNRKVLDRLERLSSIRSGAIRLSERIKSFRLDKSLISDLDRVSRKLDSEITDICESNAWVWIDHEIHERFGLAYQDAWNFKKKKAKNRVDLFAIRAIYILFRECGFNNPSHSIVAIAASFALERGNEIDKTSVREQVRDLKGDLSFEKYDRGDVLKMFLVVDREDSKSGK